MKRIHAVLAVVLAMATGVPLGAQRVATPATIDRPRPLEREFAEWNRPAAPFRIAGNLYSVGARNVAAYVLKTDRGLVLFDTGFAQTVPVIAANLKALGMRLEDVKLILASHAHFDHVGGVARVKAATGAKLAMSAPDAALMASGGRRDFAWPEPSFAPARADRILRDGERLRFGAATLTAHVTPGHTQGCTTWSIRVEERGRPVDVVYLCGTSAPGYDLVDNPRYPRIVDDYRRSFARMAKLRCDIVLTGHPQGVDRRDCAGYISRQRAAFEREVARQRAGGAVKPL